VGWGGKVQVVIQLDANFDRKSETFWLIVRVGTLCPCETAAARRVEVGNGFCRTKETVSLDVFIETVC
jgi:hypothetical protein